MRQARQDAGLSLAQVAGNQVSRTFIHFIEKGRSRPSPAVLSLIAKRTGRPVSYFLKPSREPLGTTVDLATELLTVAERIRQLIRDQSLPPLEQEVLKLLELNLRHGAQLTLVIKQHDAKRSTRPSRT